MACHQSAVESMLGLHDVCGFWRRTSIAWPDGRRDTDTDVFWLQGPRGYADLRIPAGRPDCPSVTCLRALKRPMLSFMARQEGFFGCLDVTDSVGHWHRAFDYQPDTGVADRGALAFEGDMLVEHGIDRPYVEHWSRQGGTDDCMALSLATETGPRGCLVVAGDAFIYARGRMAPLPPGNTLAELLDNAASLQAAQDLFDCEISFGYRESGVWRIARSSLCYREGVALTPVLDRTTDHLTVDDLTPEGAPIKRAWRIAEYECTDGAALAHRFRSDAAHDPSPQPGREMQDLPQ